MFIHFRLHLAILAVNHTKPLFSWPDALIYKPKGTWIIIVYIPTLLYYILHAVYAWFLWLIYNIFISIYIAKYIIVVVIL